MHTGKARTINNHWSVVRVSDISRQVPILRCPSNTQSVHWRSLSSWGIPPSPLSLLVVTVFFREGKVKYIGICECNGETLRRAYKVHPIAAIQVEYSPFTLDAEDPKIGAFEAARELGVTVYAYSPLGRGLLTGKYVRSMRVIRRAIASSPCFN
jgi:aryl-alcohol dehydrogenase-like predicted oxidoreductase